MKIDIGFNWCINNENVDTSLFDLLEQVNASGSLKKAAEYLQLSYRYSWGLLNKWEKVLGKPVVIMERGRGARLSPLGQRLLQSQHQLNASHMHELANFSTTLKRDLTSLISPTEQSSLRIFASHGLAINALKKLVEASSSIKIDLHYHGSLESLNSLAQNRCQVAGFHIPEGTYGAALKHTYRELIDSTHQLIYVVKRQQGFMVAQGNPKKIQTVEDLLQPDITFINRQSDSGTRLLFDQILKAKGIGSEQINGYQDEEFTHMAVAAMVASGVADVGFGIAPIADQFKLGFMPVVWEHYCLAIPHEIKKNEQIIALIDMLQSDAFKQALSGLSGYQSHMAGKSVNFEDIFA